MNQAETVSRLRRLADDWRKEEKQLCEHFGNDIIPQSMRERIIKDTQAIATAVKMIEQQERIFDVIERTWYKQGLDIRGASLSYFMTDVHSALEESK